MIKTMTKSLALAAAIAAMGAIAIPSMASAATWSPLDTVHTLTSPSSITFNIQGVSSTSTFSCSSGPRFSAQVRTPASSLMDMTSTSTLSCTGTTNSFAPCNVALAMNGLPLWNVDGTSTTNVKVNSVNIEATFTSKPGQTCGLAGGVWTITGQLAGGVWSNLTRSLAFTNGTGLTFQGPTGPWAVTVTASEFIKDTTSPFVSLM